MQVEQEIITDQKQEPKWTRDMTENASKDKLSDQILKCTVRVNT